MTLSCKVSFIDGPTLVATGETVTYEVGIEATNGFNLYVVSMCLYVETPAAWEILDVSYSGTLGGEAFAGTADLFPLSPEYGTCDDLGPAPGFVTHLYTTEFVERDVLPTDQGVAYVTMLIDGNPGVYDIRFVPCGSAASGGGCSVGSSIEVKQVEQLPLAIPTLHRAGLAAMALLLAAVAVVLLRRALHI